MDDLKSFLQPLRKFLEARHCHDDLTKTESDASLHFSGEWLPCHAIDLHPDGTLNAHVDSVRFSGNLVAGLSLLSSSIMRLKPSINTLDKPGTNANSNTNHTSDVAQQRKGFIDLFLPARSLYVLSGMSRYEFTHELLPSGSLFRDTTPIHRNRRLSILFRDSKRGLIDQDLITNSKVR
jgi:alkylated DNA repair protein alkB homolog 7